MAPQKSTLYDSGFYELRTDEFLQSARKIVPFLLNLLDVSSVCDLGCGEGAWLRAFCEHGVTDVLGVDGDYVSRERLQVPPTVFQPWDLAQPLTLNRGFDLACSIEVAEHLPLSAANTMVENLCHLAPFVLFSAAIPGQGGTGHVNEQWPEFWRNRFSSAGYELVDCIRARFWNDPDVAPWYLQNLFLYVRRDRYPRFMFEHPEFAHSPSFPLDVIHPRLFALSYEPNFWTLLHMMRRIPREALKLVERRYQRLAKPRANFAPVDVGDK